MTASFGTYRHAVRDFQPVEKPLPEALLIERSHEYAVYYAPFDYINVDARLVIIGITPGLTQAVLALESAQRALLNGKSDADALMTAKHAASFGGAMRKNLVEMLDYIGMHERLGTLSTATLFGQDNHLVHFTSILRYPVFKAGNNYNGNPLGEAFAKDYLDFFISEMSALDDALYLPLGRVPEAVMASLSDRGIVQADRILSGLPHPSGANGERIAYFVGRKPRDRLSSKTKPDTLDRAKAELITKVSSF